MFLDLYSRKMFYPNITTFSRLLYSQTDFGIVKYFIRSKSSITAHTRSIKPLKVSTIQDSYSRIKNYDKNKSRNSSEKGYNKHLSAPNLQANNIYLLNEDEPDEQDTFAHEMSKFRSKKHIQVSNQENKRMLIRQSRRNLAKTIEKKFFRKPEEPNLLTWSAKEQIRYLHEKDPKEWTINKLAKSFPIDRRGILKLLNSQYRLHRQEDIVKHDLEVEKNWNDIKMSMENPEQDSIDPYETLKKRFLSEAVIANASGIKYLPFPYKETEKINTKGPFSKLVRDCYEKKEATAEIKMELANKLDKLSTILAAVSAKFKMGSDSAESFSTDIIPKENQAELQNKKYELSKNHKTIQWEADKILRQGYIPKLIGHKSTGKSQVGNSVYDENGEFLYKVP
ncbi:neugrin-like [Physella acuta]|uniref:neugrin-like n=1 Tax=Physella acuta TaxID=109671 RepID=UPI0027DD3140|nr:neugrin-like [Physella acuta]